MSGHLKPFGVTMKNRKKIKVSAVNLKSTNELKIKYAELKTILIESKYQDSSKIHEELKLLCNYTILNNAHSGSNESAKLMIKASILYSRYLITKSKEGVNHFENRKPLVEAFGFFQKAISSPTFDYAADLEFLEEFSYAINVYNQFLTDKMSPFKICDTSFNQIDLINDKDPLDLYNLAIQFANKSPSSVLKLSLYANFYFVPGLNKQNWNHDKTTEISINFKKTENEICVSYNGLKENSANSSILISQLNANCCIYNQALSISAILEDSDDIPTVEKWSQLKLQFQLYDHLKKNQDIINLLAHEKYKDIHSRNPFIHPYLYTLKTLNKLAQNVGDFITSFKKNQNKEIYSEAKETLQSITEFQNQLSGSVKYFESHYPDFLKLPKEKYKKIIIKNQISNFQKIYDDYKKIHEMGDYTLNQESNCIYLTNLYKRNLDFIKQLYQLKDKIESNKELKKELLNIFLLLISKSLAHIIDITRDLSDATSWIIRFSKLSDEKKIELTILKSEAEFYRTLASQEFMDIFNRGLDFSHDSEYAHAFSVVAAYKYNISIHAQYTDTPKSMYCNSSSDELAMIKFLKQSKPSVTKLKFISWYYQKMRASQRIANGSTPDELLTDFWNTHDELQIENENISFSTELEQIRTNIEVYFMKMLWNPSVLGSDTEIVYLNMEFYDRHFASIHILSNPNLKYDRKIELMDALNIIDKYLLVNYKIFLTIDVKELKNSIHSRLEFNHLFTLIINHSKWITAAILENYVNNRDKVQHELNADLNLFCTKMLTFVVNMNALYKTQYLAIFPKEKYYSSLTLTSDIKTLIKDIKNTLKIIEDNYNSFHKSENEPKKDIKISKNPKKIFSRHNKEPRRDTFFSPKPKIEAEKKDTEKQLSPQPKKVKTKKDIEKSNEKVEKKRDDKKDTQELIRADLNALLKSKNSDPSPLFAIINRASQMNDFEFYSSIVDATLTTAAHQLQHQYASVLYHLRQMVNKNVFYSYINKKIKRLNLDSSLNEKLAQYTAIKNAYDTAFHRNISTVPPEFLYGLAVSKRLIEDKDTELKNTIKEVSDYTDNLYQDEKQKWDDYRISLGYEYAENENIPLTKEQALKQGQRILTERRIKKLSELENKTHLSSKTEYRKLLNDTCILTKEAHAMMDIKHINPNEFPELVVNNSSIQITVPDDIQKCFMFIHNKNLKCDVEFGGSRLVLTLVNLLLNYPILIGGDYDFFSTESADFLSKGFVASKHMSNLFYPLEEGMQLSIYSLNKNDLPDITITSLRMTRDGKIKDSTGQGLIDLYKLQINCFGNPTERMFEDPRIPLRVIKYKLLLAMYGFTIGAETEQALFNFKLNPQVKVNPDHLLSILKKEFKVMGDKYLQELNYYGLLQKYPDINARKIHINKPNLFSLNTPHNVKNISEEKKIILRRT